MNEKEAKKEKASFQIEYEIVFTCDNCLNTARVKIRTDSNRILPTCAPSLEMQECPVCQHAFSQQTPEAQPEKENSNNFQPEFEQKLAAEQERNTSKRLKEELDRIARTVYPDRKEPFTYSAASLMEEIKMQAWERNCLREEIENLKLQTSQPGEREQPGEEKKPVPETTEKKNRTVLEMAKEFKRELEEKEGVYEQQAREMVSEALPKYWRWVAEGKPAYRDQQWFYDPYHSAIEFDAKSKRYCFSIQVFDSPEGDVWANGSFRFTHEGMVDWESELEYT